MVIDFVDILPFFEQNLKKFNLEKSVFEGEESTPGAGKPFRDVLAVLVPSEEA